MKQIALVLLLLCVVTVPESFAVEVTAPNAQVEIAAVHALMSTATQLKQSKVASSQKDNSNDELQTIALSLAKLGRLDQSLEVTNLMSKNGNGANKEVSQTRHTALLLAIHRSAVMGHFQHASQLTAKIKDASTKEHAVWLLMKASIQQNDKNSLHQAANLLPQIKSPKVKAGALLMLARAEVKRGNDKAAQKVLFQITALAPNDFHFLVRAAFLQSLSGNPIMATRLFDKAKKVMLPSSEKIQENWNQHGSQTDLRLKLDTSRLQHRVFGYCLLQAGFVDKWLQYYKDHPDISAEARMDMTAPLEFDRVDIAVKAAKSFPYKNSDDRMMSLIMLAQAIETKHLDEALSLLQEAGELIISIPKNHAVNTENEVSPQMSAIFLASAYLALRKDKQAQQWMQWGTKQMSAQQTAYWKLALSFPPMSLLTGKIDKSTFSPDQITQISHDIHAYSLLLTDDDDTGYQQFAQLIFMQAILGQKSEARINTELLEQHFKQNVSGKKYAKYDMKILIYVVNIAQMWKRIGDQKRRDDFINYIFDLPQDEWEFSKVQRINYLMKYRLLEEGIRLLHSLLPAQQKGAEPLWKHWGEYFADAHPDQFPDTVLKDVPLQAKAGFLSSFVNGLTKSTFDDRNMWEITHDKCYFYEGVPDGDSC